MEEKELMDVLEKDPVLLGWMSFQIEKNPQTMTMDKRFHLMLNDSQVTVNTSTCPLLNKEYEKKKNEGLRGKFVFLHLRDQVKEAIAWKLKTLDMNEVMEWSVKQVEDEKRRKEEEKKREEEKQKRLEELIKQVNEETREKLERKKKRMEEKKRLEERKKMREEKKKQIN